ncbi:neuron navigator 2-like isoform X7 [Argopecten irradians]|uniref:neuron navigator 2-like isoform X7 n=1 Tax=Argopecten irradians TaxID=31199 RepID=UPI003717A683
MASHSPRNTRIPMPRREGTSSAPPVVKSGTSVKSGGVKKEPLSTFTGITSSTSNIPSSKLSGARKTPSFIVVTSCASTNSVEISKCNDAHSTTENNMENTSMTNGSPEISPQAQTKVKIYTDWANHYLEKARHKRFISDLQQDVTDGVLLADVIEAVTNEKIKDIKNKPKNSAQMVENINTCLTFLATLGVNVEGLSAKDIKEGNLKSILGLFFSLSRFKQQQKSLHQQNKEHSQSKVQQGEVTLDNQHSGIGRNTPQLNGGEMLSRLPSPFKSGSKCPTITNPSSKDGQAHTSTSINNSRNSKSQNHSNDKVTRSQLNQQNNNISSSSSSSGSTYLNTKNNNPASSRATSPGTGAGGSGIPTPGGRSLVSPRGSDKQPRAVSSGSTTSTSSTASNKSTSHKATAAAANKNSMLDKFKFFNSKDKSKSKGGVPKSTSKSSTTSTSSCSDRSDVRSTTSSARSSSSTDPGASSSTPSNDSEPQSPKLPPKTGKSLVKGFGGRRELGGVGTDEVGAKLSNQGPSIPTVPPTHSSQSHSPGKKVSGKSDRRETRSAQASPTQGKKGATKIGSLIPKSSSGKSSSSKSSPSNGPNSSQIPTPGSSIPKPSSSLGKSSKSTKEEKSRLQSKSQHSSPTSSSSLPQKSHHVSSPKSMQYQPQAPQPSNSITQSKGSTHTPEGSSDQSNVSSQDPVSDDKMQHRTRYTEIEYSDGRIERVGEGHFAKPNNLLVSPKVGGGHYQDRSHEVAGQPNMVPSSQTVNVVKPTCSVATTSTTVMTKSDGNTQTSLSVLNRATPPPLPKTEPPQKSHAKDKEYKMSGSQSGSGHSTPVSGTDSTPSSQSGSNTTGSSSESVICNKSLNVDDFSGSDKSSTSATSSPRLGMKVIHSQLQRPANNVAIVQPRHGEKIETTFDTEIRTETVNKDSDTSKNNLRETTFSEKSEKDPTFVDDSGEAMDIKPMQPIMRAMPYGSSGYLRGYGSPGSPASGKIFHNPGYATPTTAYYARTSSLGINRPMIGDPNKYYPGSIKRTQSTGQNSSIDTDYSSDYDTYDYVSGYMSDGDILKGNKMGDDMSSGYLSEGGASLYARRLQQRFREGMQAVKECMQKSTGLLDDDSFDDSSSISSGDISDTINEISTDEGNLTGGSSRDSERNPYSSLKRNPKELGRNLNNGNFQGQFPTQKRAPNLGTSAFLGSDYSSDAPPVSGWRKYSLPQTNRLLSSDPADYAHLYNGYDHSQWRPNQANVGQLRKLSNSSQPEIHHYRAHSADSADTQSDKGGYSSAGFLTKRDSETNTDQSHLLDSSMRRMQTQRAHSAGGQVTYGYRRPLSNTSNSSVGSNKSTGSNTGKTSAVGSRLAKHGMLVEQGQPNGKSMDVNGGSSIPRPGSATGMRATTPGGGNPRTDMGPEAYSSATLERKKKGLNGSPKSTSAAQTDPGELYKSNTLGRTKKVFGSRNSLSKTQAQVHGSNLSLVSSSSSIYSSNEEKHNHEIRKLRRELESAQEKVVTLSTQLSTNAHVVAAFEQSLSNMTNRLQHLTCTAEQKDSELNELRVTIEALKRQSGLNIPDPVISPNAGRRHTSPGMVANCSPQQHPSPHHTPGRAFHTLPMPLEGRMTRQMSTDSVSSINSMSSACSMTSQQSAATDGDIGKKKKKKGWLRSSFSKAFSRKKNRNGSMSDCELDSTSFRSNMSAPNSPLLQVHMPNGSGLIKGSHSSSALYEAEDMGSVLELRKQLRDKDMKLTDIRLEALSSAHQLEQLRETMTKMKSEMGALKADNDRLQRMMSARNLNTSQNSLAHTRTGSNSDTLERSLSMQEQPSLEMLLAETPDREGKRVTIMVYLGSNPDPMRIGVEKPAEVLIGSLSVSGKTKWDILDNIVRKILKEYVLRVDPVTNLGLSAESVCMYHIGEIIRTKNADLPELLPVGYLVGDTMQIGICLKGTKQNSVDSLAFETLIPKSIVQRYVSLLLEHRRIILCGPSGTGKTYLAQKLAEHLVLRSGKELTAGSVATFNVDHKSAKELRQYLSNIADQCENSSVGELPSVIILDNLHHVGSLGEVFNGFLSVKYQKCPYIIGTMNQATCSTTNLQLHHNFRWVLCANHMEPVKGFLGRYLRRKLVEAEVRTSIRNNDLNKIIDWIPKVWLHLNKFLETHSSSDVTIGPRLFLSCPMEIPGSKIWFTDLWNYSIIPYMLEAVREGLQVYGRRAPWEDPTDWVLETYPWATAKDEDPALLRIRPEDVGYDTQGVISAGNSPQPQKAKTLEMKQSGNGDPLLNMIMRLQEAANGSSSAQSQDSDSTSLDSFSSHDISTSSVESAL